MDRNRLSSLALLNVHRKIRLDADDIIDEFAIRHPRRMRLNDVLNTDPK